MRSVCKVNIYSSPSSLAGSGTGFMVSPLLLITNNHVLSESRIAKYSKAQFNHQLDVNRNILPAAFFSLDPDTFFLTDKELDYTLVAVRPDSGNNAPLWSFGWNKLMGEGKALIGDHLNIIQHPGGDFKKIVLQSNELIDLLPLHAHYLGDTEPGSSGALVCNNQLEVVALHHSGIPEIVDGNIMDIDGSRWDGDDPDTIHWIANEGVRISRIIDDVKTGEIPVEWEATRSELFEAVPPNPIELYIKSKIPQKPPVIIDNPLSSNVSWTIPLKITVSIDNITRGNGGERVVIDSIPAVSSQPDTSTDAGVMESNVVPVIDPDYSTRSGYNENYLGIEIPVPKIKDENKASKMEHGRDYTRKGLSGLGDNDREAWLTDPRIPEAHQLPDKFYNYDRQSFDKGHIVRRDDVAWGESYDEVRSPGDLGQV